MIIRSVFGWMCCGLSLFAQLESHLKPALNKEQFNTTVEEVDFIYLINLDQRPEKLQLCNQELNPYGIYPYRFSAVNGWEVPMEKINSLGVCFQKGMKHSIWGTYYKLEDHGQPHHEIISRFNHYYFSHCLSRGAIGITLSHLSIINDAYNSGYETIWIMEDDIEVIQHPKLISERIKELDSIIGKNKWDLLFTDLDTKDQNGKNVPCMATCERPNYNPNEPRFFLKRDKISPHLRSIGARYGAYSYIVRRSGMEKILDFYKKYGIFLPYDIDIFLIDGIKAFTTLEDIVSTKPNAISDNGGENYQKVKEML